MTEAEALVKLADEVRDLSIIVGLCGILLCLRLLVAVLRTPGPRDK